MQSFRIALLIFLLINFKVVFSECNFKTSNYIKEINNPINIKNINIEIPKSSSFNKNIFRIITSKEENINPKYKKNFKAKIKVIYPFGSCEYTGKVRQHGDWKDHIRANKGGHYIQSLRVTMDNGNVVGSVKFKLLLPETRINLNEILGIQIIKKLGFLTPETFQVNVKINGKNNLMLFQEDFTKELLEKNNRREGPIFNADESLLWSYNDKKNFELESHSFSKVLNNKWFEKGPNSEQIIINGFEKMQLTFLNYIFNSNYKGNQGLGLFPNGSQNDIYEKYFYTMSILNGIHALRPHNMVHYFDAINNYFEPIYYDGIMKLHNQIELGTNIFDYAITNNKNFSSIKEIFESEKELEEIKKLFNDRIIEKHDIDDFYNKAIFQIRKNIILIDELINKSSFVKENSKVIKESDYQKKLQIDKFHQNLFLSLEKIGDDIFELTGSSGKIYHLNRKEVINLLSNNTYNKERYVYLPFEKNVQELTKLNKKNFENGEIIFSDKTEIYIDDKLKIINIILNTSEDWILFKDLKIDNYKITMNSKANQKIIKSQRFNNLGLTGCLNFINVFFKDVDLYSNNALCEDAINIISSSGKIDNIDIKNSYSDGLDIDFSEISIKKINIEKANNDCIDLSGGNYNFINIKTFNCGDKSISSGENSIVVIDSIQANGSNIGISSKDYSITQIKSSQIESTKICYEAKQKKQEFGGGFLQIENSNCSGTIYKDNNSEILL